MATPTSLKRPLVEPMELFARRLAEGLPRDRAYLDAYPAWSGRNPAALYLQALRLSQNPRVQLRVRELREGDEWQSIIHHRTVAEQTLRLATSSMARLIVRRGTGKKSTVRWLLPDELDQDTAATIKSIELHKDGSVRKYTLHSKDASLDRAAKMLGMYEADNAQRNPLAELWKLISERSQGLRPSPGSDLPIAERVDDDDGEPVDLLDSSDDDDDV